MGAEEKEQEKRTTHVIAASEVIKSGVYYIEEKEESVVAEVGSVKMTAHEYRLTPVEGKDETSESPEAK